MRKIIRKPILLIIILSLLLPGCSRADASAAPSAKPWPTHAPDATPYVRPFRAEDVQTPEHAEAEPVENFWESIYDSFGNFYAKDWELEMFRALPQDVPYDFVPHTPSFGLDEGEAMRMARLFDGLDGCEARVIALHQITDGLDDWGYLTVVTMTPARLFELSETLDETFMFEQFYESVRERFDIDYWPDGLYAETEKALAEYEVRGCLYFAPETLEQLEKMERDAYSFFALREYTPDGWSKNGLDLFYVLYYRELVDDIGLRYRDSELVGESVLVIGATPAQLSVLSDSLPGRYLVEIVDEALERDYPGVLLFDPETGEPVEVSEG